MDRFIYLDYAATTPVDERIIEAMLPFFRTNFGNPSSIHTWGQKAEQALEGSRHQIASILGAKDGRIVFTSCGTESDNLALRGVSQARKRSRGANHILISAVEHPAVSQTATRLAEDYGFIVEKLPVDQYGRIHPADVENALRPDTALVSVVYANNEIGTINPVSEIGGICRRAGITFHTDAVQAAAHLPINVQTENIDLLSLGAHKFYGPKGVGALYLQNGLETDAIQTGGKQEFGLRAGTQNIPYIVGMAYAYALVHKEREERNRRIVPLRDRIIMQVLGQIPQAQLTGHPYDRLPNHASFAFEGVDGNHLLMLLDMAGFGCSSGSACKVGSPKPSEVLLAMGVSKEWALGSLRITLGQYTTEEEISLLLEQLPGLVEKARKKGL